MSSDFGNHPLSHLMGSVFGMHNREHVEVSHGAEYVTFVLLCVQKVVENHILLYLGDILHLQSTSGC